MGMNLDGPIYLQRNGWLTAEKNKILDIGPQTIYFTTADQVREFVTNQGGKASASEIERLVYFSTPRDGERTTMFSEIVDLTSIEYASIDVCPGLKNTEILDLNFDALPKRMRGHFDVVFNFGTTEHIVNQWNCFEVIHDALKVGDCYTPLFFKELAAANNYTIEQLAVTSAGESRIDQIGIQSMAGDSLLKMTAHLGENNRIPALNIHVVARKEIDAPFRSSLELATSHSPVDPAMLARYGTRQQAPNILQNLGRYLRRHR